jgi:hypothetical protein
VSWKKQAEEPGNVGVLEACLLVILSVGKVIKKKKKDTLGDPVDPRIAAQQPFYAFDRSC